MDAKRDKILRKDLVRIGLLGCGGFGAVELWEHKVAASQMYIAWRRLVEIGWLVVSVLVGACFSRWQVSTCISSGRGTCLCYGCNTCMY